MGWLFNFIQLIQRTLSKCKESGLFWQKYGVVEKSFNFWPLFSITEQNFKLMQWTNKCTPVNYFNVRNSNSNTSTICCHCRLSGVNFRNINTCLKPTNCTIYIKHYNHIFKFHIKIYLYSSYMFRSHTGSSSGNMHYIESEVTKTSVPRTLPGHP